MAGRIVVEMSGEEQALLRSLRNVVDQQTKMASGAKKVGDESAKAGKQMRNDFGTQALADIKNYALGFFGVSQAVAEVGKAFAFAKQESKDALASMKELTEERRRLVQVSRTGEEFQQLSSLADKMAMETGIQRQAARQVVFDAKSMGFLDIAQEIAESREVIEPAVASKAAGKIPEIYKGKVSPLAAVNMALAAGEASVLNVEDFIQNLPKAAEGAVGAGSSPAEAAALLSVMAGQFASGETAADRIKAFGAKVSIDKQLQGKGVLGAFDALRAMPEEKRKSFLGDSTELNVMYQKLEQNAAQVRQRTAEVQAAIDTAGTEASPLARKRALAVDVTTPEGAKNAAQRLMEKAERRREIARESRFAGPQAEREAAVADAFARMDEAGTGFVGKFGANRVADLAKAGILPAAATGPSMRVGAAAADAMSWQSLIPGVGQAAMQLRMFTEVLNQTTAALKRQGQQQSRGAQIKERSAQRE